VSQKPVRQLPLRIDGMEVKFYSNDHMPEHFHIQRKGEWKIIVRFLTSNSKVLDYTLEWKKTKEGPGRSDTQKIIDYIINYKDLIIIKWNSKHEEEQK
jgi:hypothetical protein